MARELQYRDGSIVFGICEYLAMDSNTILVGALRLFRYGKRIREVPNPHSYRENGVQIIPRRAKNLFSILACGLLTKSNDRQFDLNVGDGPES